MFGTIVQLSDIHIDTGNEPILKRGREIADAVIGQCPDAKFIILLISGDISFSGEKSQFTLAKDFIDQLVSYIKERLPVLKHKFVHVLPVPGNHDCDFSSDRSLRQAALDRIYQSKDDDRSLIEEAVKINDNYYSFVESLTGRRVDPSNKIVDSINLFIEDQSLLIHCINSSWPSQIKQNPGTLWAPIGEIEKQMEDQLRAISGNPTTVISMMHHPYNWFIPDVGRSLRRKLEQYSDIIFTGHEHDHETYSRISDDRTFTTYIEGDVLSDRKDHNVSGFNLITLDLQSRKRLSQNYQWDVAKKRYVENSAERPSWYLFNRMTDSIVSNNKLNEDWSKELDDPEIGFKHPRVKGHLRLEQIFLYPDLSLRLPGKTSEEPVKSGLVIDSFIKNKLMALIGPKSAGKTAICKTLYKDFISQGIFPVYLKGSLLSTRSSNPSEYVKKLIEKHYAVQYYKPKDSYWSIPFQSRAVIIDDFFFSNKNEGNTQEIILSLKDLFDHIVITGSNDLLLDDLLRDESKETIISSFSKATIKQFGHLLRSKFVESWFKIGLTNEDNLEQFAERAHEVEKIVTQVIGKNLIPAYPMYLLMILQAIQSGGMDHTGDVAYGPLYTQLIMDDLRDVYKEPAEIDAVTSLLSLVAYRAQKQNISRISHEEITQSVSDYNAIYGDDLDAGRTVKALIKTGIIRVNELDEVAFSYSYYLFYFVATYLVKNIQDEEVRSYIRSIASDLYNEENGNTLLFLSSMSNDKYIIDSILLVANGLFTDSPRYDFLKNDMLPRSYEPSMSGRLLINPESHKRHRERHLTNRDDIDERDEKNGNSDRNEVNERIRQFNSSYKTVQILGQILAHSAGSIKSGEKERIAKSGYDLALRTLSAFYGLINAQMDSIGNKISSAISTSGHKGTGADKKSLINRIIGGMVESLAFGVISHSAECFGHRKLTVTLENLYPKNGRTCADDLLLLAIAIEKSKPFPKDNAITVYEKYDGEPFAMEIIRMLIQQHFYLHEVSMSTIQAVCSRVGIEIKGGTPFLNRGSKISMNP